MWRRIFSYLNFRYLGRKTGNLDFHNFPHNRFPQAFSTKSGKAGKNRLWVQAFPQKWHTSFYTGKYSCTTRIFLFFINISLIKYPQFSHIVFHSCWKPCGKLWISCGSKSSETNLYQLSVTSFFNSEISKEKSELV